MKPVVVVAMLLFLKNNFISPCSRTNVCLPSDFGPMNMKRLCLGPVDGGRVAFHHKAQNINIDIGVNVSLERNFLALGSNFVESKFDLKWMSVNRNVRVCLNTTAVAASAMAAHGTSFAKISGNKLPTALGLV